MGLIDELLDLERRGWDSLCDGTGADVYGDLMTDDGLMLLVGAGVMDRATVIRSLADSPTWDDYAITDERVVDLGEHAAALVYVGTAHRGDEAPFRAAMASTYVREDGAWRLALYQQTAL